MEVRNLTIHLIMYIIYFNFYASAAEIKKILEYLKLQRNKN